MDNVMEHDIQCRTELLLGEGKLSRIRSARVLIFGVGGVGSWCAEGLVRSGVRHLTIVDSDRVSASNCNRQLMATAKTIGKVKVDVLKDRLLEINPDADIVALQAVYDAESADSFHLEEFDFIIDAIDSLKDKVHLILHATSLPKRITFISSMGAALRVDPFKVRKAEFWDVKGDPLARAIRKRFKHMDTYPSRKFQCIYSEELPMENMGDPALVENESCPSKAQINGSLCHVTSIFGMSIAGMVIKKIAESE